MRQSTAPPAWYLLRNFLDGAATASRSQQNTESPIDPSAPHKFGLAANRVLIMIPSLGSLQWFQAERADGYPCQQAIRSVAPRRERPFAMFAPKVNKYCFWRPNQSSHFQPVACRGPDSTRAMNLNWATSTRCGHLLKAWADSVAKAARIAEPLHKSPVCLFGNKRGLVAESFACTWSIY